MAKKRVAERRLVLREKIYVPVTAGFDSDVLRDDFVIQMFDEKACEPCEFRDARPTDECRECPGWQSETKLFKEKTVGGVHYVGLPYGLRKLIPEFFPYVEDLEVDDKRAMPAFRSKLKFTGSLRPHQIDVRKRLMKYIDRHGYLSGLLKAPPRSGKCVVGTTQILTREYGLIPIRDLFPERLVHDTATPLRVQVMTDKGWQWTDGSYVQRVSRLHTIQTYFGHVVRGTDVHPVLTVNADTLALEYKHLQDVRVGDWTVSEPIGWGEDNPKVTPEEARLLGYFVANGYLNLPVSRKMWVLKFTSGNPVVQKDFLRCLRAVFKLRGRFEANGDRTPDCNLYGKARIEYLQALGLDLVLAAEKKIPQSILSSGHDTIVEFLGAYLSCDSAFSRNTLELCSASKTLMKQLHLLLSYQNIFGPVRVGKVRIQRGLETYYRMAVNSMGQDILVSLLGKSLLKVPVATSHNYDKGWAPCLPASVAEKVVQFSSYYKHREGMSYHLPDGRCLPVWKHGSLYSGGTYWMKRQQARSGAAFVELRESQLAGLNTELLHTIDPTVADNLAILRDRLARGSRFHRVISARTVDETDWVFDISVPATRNFIGNGLVVHNTVMMIELACSLKVRTLILANQYDFLRQFYNTFYGNTEVDPPEIALSNAASIEDRTGVAPVRIAKCLDDFFEGDVVLATYQTFISEVGKERLAAVVSSFGLVGVDEVHRSGAVHFLKVVASFNSLHKLGLTATPKRKDCRHVLVEGVLGPVLAEAKVETLRPEVQFVPTGCAPKKDYAQWVYFLKWQTNQEARMDLIVEHAVRDIKAGYSIVIPCIHKETVFLLVKMINCQFPRPVAAEYVGNNPRRRDEVRNAAINGDIKVVVGIRSLVSTGINVPRWNMLYEICPTTNGPQFEQEFFRILTPMEGKKQPIVKFFVDGGTKWWLSSLRVCLWHKENGLTRHKAIISTEQWAIVNGFLNSRGVNPRTPVRNKDASGRRSL